MHDTQVCLFAGRDLVVRHLPGGATRLPRRDELPPRCLASHEAGHFDNGNTQYIILSTDAIDSPLPEDIATSPLRPLFATMNTTDFTAACKASQIVYWDSHSRYCPACGAPTQRFAAIGKRCTTCNFEIFPSIHPAVIVRIERNDEILLVRAHNFRGNHYGLVAGFVEPGETFEECVRREVMEETGLSISDLRYYGSQSWPFPSGIMVGFTARYAAGDIRLQTEELADAAFFRRDNLPTLPDSMSIARRLIDDWLARHK